MPNCRTDGYFPPPRHELLDRLEAGDKALREAMQQNPRRFGRGAVLVKAAEEHRAIYRLQSGTAARVRILEDDRRQIIAIFLPGDLLAIKSMLFDRQPDSIECLSACRVEVLSYTDAIALAAGNSDVAFRLMWQLAEDERRLHKQVVILGRGNAVERISAMLMDLSGRLAKLGFSDAERRRIAIRQQDIADYIGLTIMHVNRTLRTLRKQGTIATQFGNISVIDPETVGRYAAPMLDIFEREAVEFGGSV